jgi:hypothetical protein
MLYGRKLDFNFSTSKQVNKYINCPKIQFTFGNERPYVNLIWYMCTYK